MTKKTYDTLEFDLELYEYLKELFEIEIEEIMEYLSTYCADCANEDKILIIIKYSEIFLKLKREMLIENTYKQGYITEMIYADCNKKLRHSIIDSIKNAADDLKGEQQ